MLAVNVFLFASSIQSMQYEIGDMVKIVAMRRNDSFMNDRFGEITAIQRAADHEINSKYRIKLLSNKAIVRTLDSMNFRRIGIIRIYPSSQSNTDNASKINSQNPTINIGIERDQNTLDEYRNESHIPENVFGFESAGGKLQEIKEFIQSNSNKIDFNFVAMIFSVNRKILKQALKQTFPKNFYAINSFMRFREHILPSIFDSDCVQFGNDSRSFKINGVQQLVLAHFYLGETFEFDWYTLMYQVIEALKAELKREYYDQEYRVQCFDEFVNQTLAEAEYLDDRLSRYTHSFWSFVALRDLLASRHIISKYIADGIESKDMDIRINAVRLQSMRYFLKQRLRDLGYDCVDARVKAVRLESAEVGDDAYLKRIMQVQMTRFLEANVIGKDKIFLTPYH